ncbi:MAG: recombinase family protein [Oscillospiraceae bacterium]|nr:recombinase family protein [Oscillospiraceae bacterium]
MSKLSDSNAYNIPRCYNAGLYLRLSVEDAVNTSKRGKVNPFQNDSASIENQRALLSEYAGIQGWNVSKVYSDDGYSGASYDNRPAFLEMVEDAKAGLIDLILVKDLSRLGRDYIGTGYYTDEVFPSLGVRFIALMDNIDSEGDSDLMPFRSIMNDYHLRDLSRKVKSVYKAKAANGEYIGTWAPYGFIKDPNDIHRLLVDDYAADIVRRIFDMRVQGFGFGKIAAALNNEGIASPRTYFYQKTGAERPPKVWIADVIKKILANEAYIGNAVRFKTGYISYRNRLQVRKPEAEWIRCDNVFPPIISREVWEQARRLGEKRGENSSVKAARSLFSGLLRCFDCGGAMQQKNGYYTNRITGEKLKYHHYICSKFAHSGSSVCSSHMVSEEALLQIIREDIGKQLEKFELDDGVILREIQKRMRFDSLEEAKKQHEQLSARLTELESVGKKLYEDRLKGIISVNTFTTLYTQSEEERAEAHLEFERLSEMLRESERRVLDMKQAVPLMREFLSLESPSHETLTALIDHIVVGKSVGRKSKKVTDLEIVYRFGFGARASSR